MFYQMTHLLLSCSMTAGYPDSIGPVHEHVARAVEVSTCLVDLFLSKSLEDLHRIEEALAGASNE